MKIKDRIKAFKRVHAKDLLPQKEEMDMSGLPPLWRPVVGYEGIYEVSRLGQVRRVKCGRGAASFLVVYYSTPS